VVDHDGHLVLHVLRAHRVHGRERYARDLLLGKHFDVHVVVRNYDYIYNFLTENF